MAMMDKIPLDGDSKKMVIMLMNAQYPDAIRLYVKHFFNKQDVHSAILTDVTEELLHIRSCDKLAKRSELSMPYVDSKGDPVVCRSVGDCRKALVGMARTASEATGEKIDLPEPRSSDMPGGEQAEQMHQMLQQMKQLMEQSDGAAGSEQQQEEEEEKAPTSSPGTVIQRGGTAVVAKEQLFKGEGAKLGGGYSASSSAPAPATSAPVPLREVDPEQPFVRLRVQLLDKKPAQLMVNKDFTLLELRAWLQHHQGGTDAFHVMDVGGFPPKKLSNMAATVEDMGLTATTSLACRRA